MTDYRSAPPRPDADAPHARTMPALGLGTRALPATVKKSLARPLCARPRAGWSSVPVERKDGSGRRLARRALAPGRAATLGPYRDVPRRGGRGDPLTAQMPSARPAWGGQSPGGDPLTVGVPGCGGAGRSRVSPDSRLSLSPSPSAAAPPPAPAPLRPAPDRGARVVCFSGAA